MTREGVLSLGKAPLIFAICLDLLYLLEVQETVYELLTHLRKLSIELLLLLLREVLWLRKLLKDLGLRTLGPRLIWFDNKVELSNVANPVHHEWIKDVDLDSHFSFQKGKQSTGAIKKTYIPLKQQIAVIFIKQLSVNQHNHLHIKLGVHSNIPLQA